jgi:hypothetical protein
MGQLSMILRGSRIFSDNRHQRDSTADSSSAWKAERERHAVVQKPLHNEDTVNDALISSGFLEGITETYEEVVVARTDILLRRQMHADSDSSSSSSSSSDSPEDTKEQKKNKGTQHDVDKSATELSRDPTELSIQDTILPVGTKESQCSTLGCKTNAFVSKPSTIAVSVLFILSLCFLAYRRRRLQNAEQNRRGRYAAIAAEYDEMLFDDTFTDEASFFSGDKDDKDDNSIASEWSDNGQTLMELTAVLKDDEEYGGLSLQEVNG